jgi:type I restriction enzyme R subunit
MFHEFNQNPEQRARDIIDNLLTQSGWLVQNKKEIDFSAGTGVAVKEYYTDAGPADYVLFIEGKPRRRNRSKKSR